MSLDDNKQINIMYTGWSFAGSLTSLRYILSKTKLETTLNTIDLYSKSYSTQWFYKNKIYEINLKYGKFVHGRRFTSLEDGIRKGYIATENIEYLKIVDGIIFVWDSQIEMQDQNVYFLWQLSNFLKEIKREINQLPIIFQINKRDLPNILSIETIKQEFFWPSHGYVESIATQGKGIEEALNKLVELVMFHQQKELVK